MCVTWLIHMCDLTHSCVRHDSFICVTCLIHMCNMTHSYVWHDSFICVTWLIHMCDMTHLCMCDMARPWVWHVSFMCDVTYSCVWHDPFMCVVWLIHVWHDSSIVLMHVWHDSLPMIAMNDWVLDVSFTSAVGLFCKCSRSLLPQWMTCAAWLTPMPYPYGTWLTPEWRIHVWHDSFTWLIHMWHDSFTQLIHVWHVSSKSDSFICELRITGLLCGKWQETASFFLSVVWLAYFACLFAACYGVATISRLLKITGLFCKRALQKRPIFCKGTYNFQEPTNRSHPICQTGGVEREASTWMHCNTQRCTTATHCNALQHREVYSCNTL